MNKREKLKRKLEKDIADKLVGRSIKSVMYTNDKEEAEMMWGNSGIILTLDNGETLLVSADDEGNGPGALLTSMKDLPVIPTI